MNMETPEQPETEEKKPAVKKSLVPPTTATLESMNLVDAFNADREAKEWLEKFASRVIKEDEDDVRSMEGYLQLLADALRLYFGQGTKMTTGPAKGSPAPGLPILAKIVNRIYARVVSMVDASEPVAVPTGDDDHERALRLTQHITWEKRAKHPDWKPAMNASVLQWILFGSMFRYSAWDPLANKKEICWLGASDLHMPYTDKDNSPSLENVERVTASWKQPKHKIRRLGKAGFYVGVEEMFGKQAERKPSPYVPQSDKEGPIKEVVRELEARDYDGDAAPRSIFEVLMRTSWEDLPGEDMPRRICVWVEKSTKRVLRFVVMERENKLDRLRFDNETKLQEVTQENAQAGLNPVSQVKAVEPPRTEPLFPFVHYQFMPNPESTFGLGAWVFAGQLNELANNLAGEDLVSHRMANVQGGLMSDDVDPGKGGIDVEYGRFKSVNVSVGQLGGAFMPLPFERPKGNLSQYIELLDVSAQAVMSSSDSQSGMAGPSHETARAALARMQAGSTAITAAVESFLIPLAVEYKNYARLNATYMSDAEYFGVVEVDEATGQAANVQKQIGRADYDADYDITFDSDVRLEADPGIGQSALEAYGLLKQEPLAASNPNIMLAALKKALKALKAGDLAAKLPDRIPPPPPPSPRSQVDETADFMREKDSPVLPDDDDEDHLNRMTEFESSPMHKDMSSTGKQIFQRHKQGHQAAAYQKGMSLKNSLQQMEAEGEPRPPGMAGRQ
jgi:hypothetical protein